MGEARRVMVNRDRRHGFFICVKPPCPTLGNVNQTTPTREEAHAYARRLAARFGWPIVFNG